MKGMMLYLRGSWGSMSSTHSIEQMAAGLKKVVWWTELDIVEVAGAGSGVTYPE
jgi:hypothetical protein